jgi:hypothetical protein
MTDTPKSKTATEALAALVAQRKAFAGNVSSKHTYPGAKRSETAAGARSASKSKPATGK